MRLQNFDDLERVINRTYGGATGSKIAVVYEDRVWMLKTQQNLKTKGFNNVEIQYANDMISEYIGSHVFNIHGLPVHDTVLGTYHDKIAVLCSDKAYPQKMYEFREFRNSLMNEDIIQHSSGMSTSIEDIMQVINEFQYFDRESVLQRFWNMFVIDALIGNTDRNNGNWGFMYDSIDKQFILYDVYDCGGGFNNKRSDKQMENDIIEGRVKTLALNYTFNYTVNGKRINPFKYIRANLSNPYVRNALTTLSWGKMYEVLDMIESVKPVISDVRCSWYKEILTTRYEELMGMTQ